MIERLILAYLKAQVDAKAARETPVGGTLWVLRAMHGIRAWGGRWSLDLTFRREE